ncbi:hypothetical protein ACXNSR_20255 [Streptomyces sp. NC-S4]
MPAEPRALGDDVRVADRPVRLALRSSRTSLLDTLCRRQTLRALAYVHLLAARRGDEQTAADPRAVPGPEAVGDPGLPELPARLEKAAAGLPPDLPVNVSGRPGR